jgi:hypothetical protein
LAGDIYSIYFDETVNVDFNVAGNRYRFFDSGNVPVFMGASGELAASVVPYLFISYGFDYHGGFVLNRGRSDGFASFTMNPATVPLLGYYDSSVDLQSGVMLKLKSDVAFDLGLRVLRGGLNGYMLAGKTYSFTANLYYDSAIATTGSRFVVFAGGSGTPTRVQARILQTLTATTETLNLVTGLSLPAAANASSLTSGNVCMIEGLVTPSASGFFNLAFGSEIAASNITVLKGSNIFISRLD